MRTRRGWVACGGVVAMATVAACQRVYIDLDWSPGNGAGTTTSSTTTTSTTSSSSTGTTTSTSASTTATLCAPGSTSPCYDGPAGTEGAGSCKAGTRTCATDGSSWGACTGEALPPCGLMWAHRYGDPAEQSAAAVAVDGAGDAIVTGLFDGTLDLGCNAALQSAGGADVFVAKIDPAGVCVWAKSFGDAKDQQGTAITVDNSGAVYVAGSFQGSIDFVGTPPLQSSGAGDVFVAKLAPDGTPAWSRSFTNANQAQINALAVDGAGNVVLTGSFSGALDFDGGPLQASASSIVVAKLDGGGNYLWSKVFGAGSGTSLVVDATGATFVTGFFMGTADFDGSMVTSAGSTDVFVAKLDAGGSVAWSKTFGDPARQDARGIALDPSGNVVITGLLFGSVSFGGPPVSGGTDGSIYAAKLDPAGGHRWSKSFGVGVGTALATDASGNVVLTGSFNGAAPADFGGGPLQGTGIGDIYLAKLDPTGGYLWAEGFGQGGVQSANGLALDAAGSAYLAGAFSGTLDFGGGPLVSATATGVFGTDDVFLAKLSP